MKKSTTLMIAVFAILFAFTSNAQTERPDATITDFGIIQLPLVNPLTNSYDLDISTFNFQDETAAISYFSHYPGDSFFIRPVYSQGRAILYVQVEKHTQWNLVDWNNHFRQTMQSNPLNRNPLSYEE